MNEIFRALAIVMATAGLCYAAENPAAASGQSAPLQALTSALSVQGKIESVSSNNPSPGTPGLIVIIDDTGKKFQLAVKPTTTIYDIDWKATTLPDLPKDALVQIKYKVTTSGTQEALTIRLVKS